MTTNQFILSLGFVSGSLPLVWQDVRDLAVSQGWLFSVLTGWMVLAWWTADSWPGAAALSAGVLTVGTVFLLISPQSLGEADVVYMAALAWLLPFWSFLFAIGFSVLLGMGAFAAVSSWGRRDMTRVAMPYLPCLALGGFAVLGGLA